MKKTLRTLKLVVTLLVLSNLVTGFSAFYLLGHIDKGYSDVLGPALPSLLELRQLTQETLNAHRALLNLLLAENAEESAIVRGQFVTAEQACRKLVEHLDDLEYGGPNSTVAADLNRAGMAYLENGLRVCSFMDGGRKQEALALRATKLRQTFETFQSAQNAAVAALCDEAAKTGAGLTASVNMLRWVILGICLLPALVMLGLGALFVVFLVQLMGIFRRL
jgi:hypothetical protein